LLVVFNFVACLLLEVAIYMIVCTVWLCP